MGWGGFLDKLINKLPIQDRKERWKNELENIRKERESLIKETWDVKKGKRLSWINGRIIELEQLLRNA